MENQIRPVLCVTGGLRFWFSHPGRKDDGKYRINEGVQGKAKTTAVPGKHQFILGIKASLNCYSTRMKGTSLQLEKGVLKITSHPFTLGSKEATGSKLRRCLTQIHVLHQYCKWVCDRLGLKIHHPELEESTNKAWEMFDWWLPFILPEKTAH